MRIPLIIAIGLIVSLGMGASPGLAEDSSAKLHDHVSAINRAAQLPRGEEVVAGRLSKDLGIQVSTLESQRAQTKLGWGELLIANRLAQQTGLSFDQVVGEFRSGKGWGKIANERNVNLGQLVSDASRSAQAVEAEARRAERGPSSSASGPAGDKPSVSDRPGPSTSGMGTSGSGPGSHGTGVGGPPVRGGGRGR
jgi:hypothetical protein